MSEYAERIRRATAQLRQAGADLLVVGPSSDLIYLTGLVGNPSERFKVLLVSAAGETALVLPAFEVSLVDHLPVRPALYPWEETEDPLPAFRRAARALGGGRRVAVGPQLWSTFLLRLQGALPDAAFMDGGPLLAPLRIRKSPEELELMRTAARIADQAYLALLQQPLAGRTEREVLALIHDGLRRAGMERLGGGIVGAGPNGASPHYKTADHKVVPGDALVIDFGGQYRNYWADITRTPHVGPPGDDFRFVYRIVQEAQQAALEAVRPGVSCEAIDRVARDHIARHGFGEFFVHRTGHGIGLDGHEEPYLVQGNSTPLEEGMTFSLEPGIYLPGQFGVRIEDIVAVTADGAERLNTCSRDLTVVT
ncbi:MAG: Xaa-Pro peptidase family protein [Armatimonadota bacterium]|nr:Xaa-Pro peptidase family protein [Armatimonadota bacterium]MDR7426361.1 Xaa-Pro peptidase family protein [Armatimonadota bacterium]MDR7463341.1 Xaa-Pro peptidase family protein [Armatimonadota bacterium]MDR7469155.1 Xaa-Pro peptidase family protein [Armatimonadota bacterium]MDR7474574.1 Xaa-Pro peptidase family protein [Armatimonadota bacterium]